MLTKSQWFDLLKMIVPTLVAAAVPGGVVLGPVVLKGMEDAENLKKANGADKKAHVIALVTDAVIGINTAHGDTVLDPATTVAAAGSAIDLTIAMLKLVEHAKPVPIAGGSIG